ncbi:AsmA family protein [Marinicella sp. S1101]|uniref:AsmA family protein n=1 Tax=Marinicella marina TaxID=2996016 RepID=UPI0022609B03|nr:AsmA family protein [Marinicella marina]MCX7554520.1 AsmA family protein [Marinicella marina]MDJ1140671.1 AsmA family protein [Marinicella marina]
MKKLIKWIFGVAAVLVGLVVLAIIILPMVFDPNQHKPQIQQAIATQLGRDVELNGEIEWSVFPSIAINLNQVTVKNAAGFRGETLAEVERIAVGVQLLPLLKKQIKVGQVELQQPKINLQMAQSGNSNWQSIIDHMGSGQDATETSGSSADLEVRGIAITDGELNYKDASAGMEIRLTALNFASDSIKSNQSTPMSIETKIEMPANDLSGQLNAQWLASGLGEGSGMVLVFSDLSFNGSQSSLPLEFEVSPQTTLDLAQDTLLAEQIKLELGAMKLTTNLNGKQLSTNMNLNGQLNVAEFSMAELLNEMGTSLDNQADNAVSGTANWSLQGDRLKLNGMDFKLDDSVIAGDIDLNQLSQLRGQFNLSIDQLNLDQYLPADSSDGSSSAPESDDFDLGRLSGQIKMQQLTAAGVNLNDITLNITTNGKNLTVEPLKAGFYQGLIQTELKLMPDQPTGKLQVTHSMQDFQAGNLLTDLIGTDYLTGLGQLNADVKIDQPFSAEPLKTANGRVSYRLTDGDIVGIDVFQIIQQSLSLLNKAEAAANNEELKTAFGLMEIDANINNGVLKTNKLRLNSPYFDVKGEVEIDLAAQTINGRISPMLTNIPEGVLDARFEKLIDTRIPVSLKGNLLEPSINIDVAALILATQKAKIDEKKDELKEDLFDALLGKDKDKDKDNSKKANSEMTEKERKRAEKDQMKRDLLQGLFESSKKKDKTVEKEDDGGGN